MDNKFPKVLGLLKTLDTALQAEAKSKDQPRRSVKPIVPNDLSPAVSSVTLFGAVRNLIRLRTTLVVTEPRHKARMMDQKSTAGHVPTARKPP